MENYILKLNSGTEYKLYKGTTLVSDADLTALFGVAGEMYLSFDFNSGTPSDFTTLAITNSSDVAVITNTNVTVAEGKNYKATWSASATTFDTFEELAGKALDESQLSFLMGKIKEAGNEIKTFYLDSTNNSSSNPLIYGDLDAGLYKVVNANATGQQTQVYTRLKSTFGTSSQTSVRLRYGGQVGYLFISAKQTGYKYQVVYIGDWENSSMGKIGISILSAYDYNSVAQTSILRQWATVYNGLDSTSAAEALSANQGKILADRIGDLTTLTTTAKTSTVAAINEVNSGLHDAALISSTLSTPSSVAYVATDNIQDGAVTPAKISFSPYSTSEQVVGTWVDGKPLYRKTFVVDTLSSGLETIISLSGLDFDFCYVKSAYLESNGLVFTLNRFASSNADELQVFVNKTDQRVQLIVGSAWSSTFTVAYVTVEYTKTTD